MLKHYLLLSLILVSYLGFGQTFNSGTTQTDFFTEFNYEWINEKIIIPVEIEGQTYRFVLDTGAPNIITTNLNEKITTNFQQRILITDANNKKDSLDLVTIPLMKIGGISYKDMPSLVNKKDANFIFDCFEIDGFIGSNLLRNSIVQILSKEKLIRLTDDKKRLSLNKKQATKIEFPDRQSTPYIWIELSGNRKAREQVFIDTGMSGFYDLANKHLEIFQKNNIFNINSEAIGIQGTGLFGPEEESTYYKLTVPKMEINKAIFKDIAVITTNDNNSRIGTEILLYGNVTIDYINARFYYEPFENVVDLKEKSFDFTPTIMDHKLVVGLVWNDDLRQQMKYGDQIVEINGVNYINSDLCKLITQESIFKLNEQLEMTVIDSDGNEHKLTVFKNKT